MLFRSASRFRYWLLTGSESRSCLHSSRTHRVRTLNDRYYEFMCFDVLKVVRSPGYDHGHDEESRNGRYIKIDILEGYVWTSKWFQVSSGIYRSTGRLPEPPGNLMGLNGPSGGRGEEA